MATETVLYSFEWDGDASEVIVTGTFDGWSKSKYLSVEGNKYTKQIELPRGDKVLFKFVVDGNWVTSDKYQTESDLAGIENNVIYLEELASYKPIINKSSDEQPKKKSLEEPVYKNGSATSELTLNTSNETLNAEERKPIGKIEEEAKEDFDLKTEEANVEKKNLIPVTRDENTVEPSQIDPIALVPKVTSPVVPEVTKPDVSKVTSSTVPKLAINPDAISSNILIPVSLNEKVNKEKAGKEKKIPSSSSSQVSSKKVDSQFHLVSQKSNTESSAFTNVETPSQPDTKEAENGLSQLPGINKNGSKNEAIVLNSLHLDDLDSSASFKSISSNEIFSSTHGSLSHFAEPSDRPEEKAKINTPSNHKSKIPVSGGKSEGKSLLSLSFMSRFKKIFK